MANELEMALASIRDSLAHRRASYWPKITTIRDKEFGSNGTVVRFPYQGSDGVDRVFLSFLTRKDGYKSEPEIKNLLTQHELYARLKKQQMMDFAEIHSSSEAEAILQKTMIKH
jgi:hypothetical protein